MTGPTVVGSDLAVGPLPVNLPIVGRADGWTRRTYFSARAADALYGASVPDGRATRWYRLCNHSLVLGCELLAVELLRMPSFTMADVDLQPACPPSYLVAFHLALPADSPLDALRRWVNLAPESSDGASARRELASLPGPGFAISTSWHRALSMTLITFPTDAPSLRSEGAPTQWNPSTQWLWWAATATPYHAFPPDPDDPTVLAGLVYLSRDWRGLVKRDGVAFVSLVPDNGSESTFFSSAEVYVRTIYSDVLLLAVLQREALEAFADTLARVGSRSTQANTLRALVDDLTEFRNMLWWESVTLHGVANEILARLHAAHGTTVLFDRVVEDIRSFAGEVERRATLGVAEAQEANRQRAERVAKVGVIAAIGFALPVLVFTAIGVPIDDVGGGDANLQIGRAIMIGVVSLVLGVLVGWIATLWIERKHSPRRPS